MPRSTFNSQFKKLLIENCTVINMLNPIEFREILMCVGENFTAAIFDLLGKLKVNRKRNFLDIKKIAISYFIQHKFKCRKEVFELVEKSLVERVFTSASIARINSAICVCSRSYDKDSMFIEKIGNFTNKIKHLDFDEIVSRWKYNNLVSL